MAMTEITNDTIAKEISTNTIVVIEFYSSTCSVCEKLTPVLEEVSRKQLKAKFFMINSKQNMKACMTYKVLSLPTTLIFKKGELVEKVSGFKTKEEMEEILKRIA